MRVDVIKKKTIIVSTLTVTNYELLKIKYQYLSILIYNEYCQACDETASGSLESADTSS